ncbi:MAG: PCRF domain-containing protein, partial [Firmicutes bacterium]|nr:PCRF domain-containing protein [Candidatus Scatoplasma merdavium]
MDYVINKLEEMDKRLSAIDEELTSVTDFSVAKKLNQERALLDEPVTLYRQLKKADAEIADAQLILKDSDEEMREFAKGEIARLSALKEELNKKIELALLPKDINDEKNVIMEIRGAVGGDEGNIFAGDLYRMYLKYADKKGWKVQLLDESPTSLGGYSNVSIMIKGKGVYSRLKFESGAHRVQRVPITEKSGRIQTSTATVLVMPETEKEDIVINPSDLQVDTYRSQGAGGQNVNKTESAVRITHVPT